MADYTGMPVLHVRADTVAGAYRQVLHQLKARGQSAGCQGRETLEVLGAAVRIDYPENSVLVDPARKFNYRYLLAEAMWNLTDNSSIDVLLKVHPGIAKFVEDQPEGTRHSARWAYGPGIHGDIGGILDLLRRQPDSRRAILRPGKNEWPGMRGEGTPPCLEFVQFLVRDGAVHMVVFMRSNDAYLGMPYDMFTYALWQRAVAEALGLGMGTYTHIAGSMHYYIKDQKQIDAVINDLHDSNVRSLATAPNMRQAHGPSLSRDLERLGRLLKDYSRHTLGGVTIDWECTSWVPLLEAALADEFRMSHWDSTIRDARNASLGIGW